MADSAAVRNRRYRRHKAGDHRDCLPDRDCRTGDAPGATARDAGQADGGELPDPPVPLADDGARLWFGVLGQYELAAHEREILGQAAQVLDYLAVADEKLAGGGWITEGRYGQPRISPLVEAQFRWRRQFCALLDALHLPDPDDAEVALPAGVAEIRRRGVVGG